MAETILSAESITKRFGGFVALQSVNLDLHENERLGLIGPNGSGKTTMINCISGALFNDEGAVRFRGKDISRMPAYQRTRQGIARSFQIPRPFRTMTILENVVLPMEYAAIHRDSGVDIEAEARDILGLVGFSERLHESSNNLTQVDLRKLELARAMAAKPDLLIADEAMAGLSHSEVDEILDILFKLNERGVAIIMIEHIMRAVLRFSQRVMVLDAGKKIFEGVPDDVVKDKDVERAYLGE